MAKKTKAVEGTMLYTVGCGKCGAGFEGVVRIVDGAVCKPGRCSICSAVNSVMFAKPIAKPKPRTATAF
jgi:hypothetical protein